MRRRLFFGWLVLPAVLFALGLSAGTAGPAAAQVIIRGQGDAVTIKGDGELRLGGVDSTLVARFQLADAYLRSGQFDRAVTLLEDLYAASPETFVFYEKLKEAYESVKRYDDAITLVDRWMAQAGAGGRILLMAEKGRLLYLKGDETEALALWEQALRPEPMDENTYRTVYASMFEVRLFDEATAVLEKGRKTIGNNVLYQPELAYLYSLNGQHEQAMEEYLGLLAVSDRQINYVRNRLSRFIEQEGALEASIAGVERGVRKLPLNRAYRELLAWLYLEAKDYDQALNTYRAIDRLEKENGRVLFGFAQLAADAAAYDAALEAYAEVLERYPDAPVAADAQLGLAEMYERRAQRSRERVVDERGQPLDAPDYAAALAAYRTFLERYPSHASYPEVLRRVGRLQQDVFFSLDEAETILQEVAQRYPNSEAAFRASYDLGRIALVRGDLEEARLSFSRLVEELRLGELAEQARFELALLHFYRGEFEAALTLVSAIDENTSTDVANDAIELKVLLLENKGPDSLSTPLRAYAGAALAQRQRSPGETITRVEAFLQTYGQHPLADEARFLRGAALREAGRAPEALTAFSEIPLMHPASQLADRSLFEAAEIQERELNAPEAALLLYAKLLTTYPGSLLVPEARLRIRALRGDGPGA